MSDEAIGFFVLIANILLILQANNLYYGKKGQQY